MSEMVERAALALKDRIDSLPHLSRDEGAYTIDGMYSLPDLVRTVIAAMKLSPISEDEILPTDTFRRLKGIYGSFFEADGFVNCFNSVIDEALK